MERPLTVRDGFRIGIGIFLANVFIAAIFLLAFLLFCIFSGHSVDYYFRAPATHQQER